MFAARKKIITFASVKPWGPYRGSQTIKIIDNYDIRTVLLFLRLFLLC